MAELVIKDALSFLVAFVIVTIITPYVQKKSIELGFVDRPNPRKIHSTPIPVTGGIALFLAFFISQFLIRGFSKEFFRIFYCFMFDFSNRSFR